MVKTEYYYQGGRDEIHMYSKVYICSKTKIKALRTRNILMRVNLIK